MRQVVFRGLCAVFVSFSSFAAAGTRETGPSTKTPPYLEPLAADVSLVSILTAGDGVGFKRDGVTPWRMVGVPDGLGALDNGDGTITVLMNHELNKGDGVARDHGFAGAFISKLVIDTASLRVVSGADLIQQAFEYDAAGGRHVPLKSSLAKLCSGDLAGGSAFYDKASGLGYDGRIFLSGEEQDPEGRPFAHFVTGPEAGKSYELGSLGNMAFENLLAYPRAGRRTIIAMEDDSHPRGEVYFYVGDKQATGDALDRAGLAHGRLYGLKLAEAAKESEGSQPLGPDNAAAFTLVDLGDVSKLTGAEIDARSKEAGVTAFLRPEDGAWDTVDPNRFYFNTTAAFDKPSRLWAVDFQDATHPDKGGTVRLLLKGDEGQHMLDNMTVAQNGELFLQEDPGAETHLARIFQFDPKTSRLATIAQHDPSLFKRPAEGGLTIDEESSGIIDVTPLLGSKEQRAFLLSVQPHFGVKGEIVQGGQLVLMRQETQ